MYLTIAKMKSIVSFSTCKFYMAVHCEITIVLRIIIACRDIVVSMNLHGRACEVGTQRDMCTLKPGSWLSDTPINLVVVQLTNRQKDLHNDRRHTDWFFLVYLSIYMPFNYREGHWLCVKIDMVDSVAYLFDSLSSSRLNKRKLNTAKILLCPCGGFLNTTTNLNILYINQLQLSGTGSSYA